MNAEPRSDSVSTIHAGTLSTAFRADDWITVAAMAMLAYMVANILHEGFGHGGVALLSGAQRITVTTVSMNTVLSTRWISAAGTLINLFSAMILWLVLRFASVRSVHVRYFLILTFAFNLFTGTGYFLFSGASGFGDWQDVIQGEHRYWLLRVALVVVGVVAYMFAMRIVAKLLWPFMGAQAGHSPRCWRLTVIPYIFASVIAAVASLRNPLGFMLVLESALPSTLGANIGLLYVGKVMNRRQAKYPSQLTPDPGQLTRSIAWIGTAVVLGLLYIFILGHGVSVG